MLRVEAATIIRSVRASTGLTQRGLALRCGLPQSNLSKLEAGASSPTIARLNRVLAPIQSQVAVVPSAAPTIADWADLIRELLREGDESGARVAFIRLADRLTAEDPAVRVALCVQQPPSTGDAGYDAALASTVEYLLERDGLPIPRWARQAPAAPVSLFLVPQPAIRDQVVSETPAAFSKRSVYVPADFLASH